jgi:hypothetical protein
MKSDAITADALNAAQQTSTNADGSDNSSLAITIAAVEDETWVVRDIWHSFDDTPSVSPKPSITITSGGNTIYQNFAPISRELHMHFPSGIHRATKNEAVVITIAAAGSGISARMTVGYM